MSKGILDPNKQMAEQLALNAGAKLTSRAPKRITAADMERNADAAVERGAKFLDRKRAGWANNAKEVVGGEKAVTTFILRALFSDLVYDGMEVSKADGTPADGVLAYQEIMAPEAGDVQFQNPLGDITTKDPEVRKKVNAEMFLASIGLIRVPQQARLVMAQTDVDAAYYGFVADFATGAYGVPSFARLTDAQEDREGFCIVKYSEYLAAAWNREIAARKENA